LLHFLLTLLHRRKCKWEKVNKRNYKVRKISCNGRQKDFRSNCKAKPLTTYIEETRKEIIISHSATEQRRKGKKKSKSSRGITFGSKGGGYAFNPQTSIPEH